VNDEVREDLVNYVDLIEEVSKVNDFLDEELVTDALNDIVKLAVRKDVPDAVARSLIVRLQALAATFAIRATFYTTMNKGRAGSVENQKKNLYYTLSAESDKVANALKYLVKGG